MTEEFSAGGTAVIDVVETPFGETPAVRGEGTGFCVTSRICGRIFGIGHDSIGEQHSLRASRSASGGSRYAGSFQPHHPLTPSSPCEVGVGSTGARAGAVSTHRAALRGTAGLQKKAAVISGDEREFAGLRAVCETRRSSSLV